MNKKHNSGTDFLLAAHRALSDLVLENILSFLLLSEGRYTIPSLALVCKKWHRVLRENTPAYPLLFRMREHLNARHEKNYDLYDVGFSCIKFWDFLYNPDFLIEFLSKNDSVTQLSYSTSGYDIPKMEAVLNSCSRRLKKLKLYDILEFPVFRFTMKYFINKALTTQLTELELCRFHEGTTKEDVGLFREFMRTQTNLRHLTIDRVCSLSTEEGIDAMLDIVEHNTTLVSLHWTDFTASDEQQRRLFRALVANRTLKSFTCMDCNLRGEYIPSNLLKSSSLNTTLTHLDLSHNAFKCEDLIQYKNKFSSLFGSTGSSLQVIFSPSTMSQEILPEHSFEKDNMVLESEDIMPTGFILHVLDKISLADNRRRRKESRRTKEKDYNYSGFSS